MLKWLKVGALAVMLALPWAFPVSATDAGGVSHRVVTNTTDQLFNAVDETSADLLAAPFTELTFFISGTYSTANTVVLQKEVGSPGSGAFETVLTLDTSTANARTVGGFTTGPNTDNYRLKMTAFGTGAVVAYMTDYPRAARNWGTSDATNIVFFDDFKITGVASATVLDANVYVITEDSGGGGQGVPAVMVAGILEGGFTHTSDDGNGEEVCVGQADPATDGSTVSDGWHMFELRVSIDVLTGLAEMGWWDTICTADTVPISITTGTVAANGATAAIAAIVLDDGATDATAWQAVSAISNAEGANALEVPMITAVVSTYVVLRLEIDNLGNAYFFVDDILLHAEPLAVLTTSEIAAFFQVESTTSTALVGTVDYWTTVQPRPTSPTS